MMRVTAVNMSVAHDRATNLRAILSSVDDALNVGADLVVFPEQSLQGYLRTTNGAQSPDDLEYQHANAEEIPGPATAALHDQLRGTSTWVVMGMTERSPTLGGALLFNSSVLIGPSGIASVYRKIHQPGDELHYYGAGSEWNVVRAAGACVGMCICYDIQFPESTRALTLQGASVIAFPTAWPEHAAEQYDLLTRTRAMENQVYLVAANQCGSSGGSDNYYGHSRVVGPGGTIIADAGTRDSVTVDIDVETGIRAARTGRLGTLNLLKDRHPDTYGIVADATIHHPPAG